MFSHYKTMLGHIDSDFSPIPSGHWMTGTINQCITKLIISLTALLIGVFLSTPRSAPLGLNPKSLAGLGDEFGTYSEFLANNFMS